jgi:hypothetical protein
VGVRGCRHWAQLVCTPIVAAGVNILVSGSMGAATEQIKANHRVRQGEGEGRRIALQQTAFRPQ